MPVQLYVEAITEYISAGPLMRGKTPMQLFCASEHKTRDLMQQRLPRVARSRTADAAEQPFVPEAAEPV